MIERAIQFGFFLWVLGGFVLVAHATTFSSANFQVQDPVLQSGQYSTSSGFQLLGSIAQISIGTSTSASDQILSGFLYFPSATIPVVTATAGDAQVSLTWTASTAFSDVLDHYDVGQSTVSGGPYAFSNVGNIVSSTRTGLTNGTTYYFIVRADDAANVTMATSTEVSASPASSGAAAAAAAIVDRGGGVMLALLKLFIPPTIPLSPGELPKFATADLNQDGATDLRDLSIFLYLTTQTGPSPADLNGDGKVDFRDLSILFSRWAPMSSLLANTGASARYSGFGIGRVAAAEQKAQVAAISETKAAVSPVAPAQSGGFFMQSVRAVWNFVQNRLLRLFK